MADITIYTTPYCPYCVRAKGLLQKKGAAYDEIDVSGDFDKRVEMSKLAGGRSSVPQIFIKGVHVGGCDDLHALDATGGLDKMLASADLSS